MPWTWPWIGVGRRIVVYFDEAWALIYLHLTSHLSLRGGHLCLWFTCRQLQHLHKIFPFPFFSCNRCTRDALTAEMALDILSATALHTGQLDSLRSATLISPTITAAAEQ